MPSPEGETVQTDVPAVAAAGRPWLERLRRFCRLLNGGVPLAGLIALCALATYYAQRAIVGIEWSFLYDAWRDIGMAQSILDGRYPQDYFLLGEISYYNPLVSFVVAAGSWVSHMPPNLTHIQLGPIVNLLTPLGFFVLAEALFDRWTALAALAFFMMGNSTFEGTGVIWGPWMGIASVYSPWLWAPHLGYAPYYFALAAFCRSGRSNGYRWHILAGVLLGITFMGHAAPAVIAGGIISLVTLGRLWDDRKAGLLSARVRRGVVQYVVLLVVAFVASLPFSLPILWRYRFHVRNTELMKYTDPYLSLGHLAGVLKDNLTLWNAFALLGLGALMFQGSKRFERRLLLSWLAIACGFLTQGYLRQWNDAVPNTIVPMHHFLISLSGVKSLLCAYGVASLAALALGAVLRLPRLFGKAGPSSTAATPWRRDLAGAMAATAMFVAFLPSYGSWVEFRRTFSREGYEAEFIQRQQAHDWILAHCRPEDVFLCEDQLGLKVVGPTARKVVSSMNIFCNPYVEFEPANCARNGMFNALAAGDEPSFRAAAETWHVSYILVEAKDMERVERANIPYITRVFFDGEFAIFRVELGAHEPAVSGNGAASSL